MKRSAQLNRTPYLTVGLILNYSGGCLRSPPVPYLDSTRTTAFASISAMDRLLGSP